MLRKTLFLITLLCTTLLLGLQTTGHADSVTASTLSGPNGNVNLYTVATGSSTSLGTSGWIYLGLADGAWFNGAFSSVKVTIATDGTRTANTISLGYLYDAYPCIAYVNCTKKPDGSSYVSATIVDYWTGAVYKSSGTGKVVSGALTLIH